MKNKKKIILVGIIVLIAIITLVCVLTSSKDNEENSEKSVANTVNSESANIENVEKVTEENEDVYSYLYRIYTGISTCIPTFADINSTDENWIWECAYKNLVNFDDLIPGTVIQKEDIEKSAKQLFGNNFNKEFPENGLEFWLEPQDGGYFYTASSYENEICNDYILVSVNKNENTIIAEIIEYRYNEIFLGEPTSLNLYKINSDEIIKSYDLTSNGENDGSESYNNMLFDKMDEAFIYVENYPEEFSKAKLTLKVNSETGDLNIVSVER